MPTAAMEQTTGRKKMDLAALLKRLVFTSALAVKSPITI